MYTILIVDDEANLLEVLAVALENMGYGTVTAETAEEALAVLEEREVHLVLRDLRLPGLSGREPMDKVKAANPDLPVVIMTAYASLKEAVEIIKEGAFDYTVKPFELDALEATIASALLRSSSMVVRMAGTSCMRSLRQASSLLSPATSW